MSNDEIKINLGNIISDIQNIEGELKEWKLYLENTKIKYTYNQKLICIFSFYFNIPNLITFELDNHMILLKKKLLLNNSNHSCSFTTIDEISQYSKQLLQLNIADINYVKELIYNLEHSSKDQLYKNTFNQWKTNMSNLIAMRNNCCVLLKKWGFTSEDINKIEEFLL